MSGIDFHPAEANIFIPVSLNLMAIMESTFLNSYESQRAASFPSWEYDGPFSRLAQRIQVEQYQTIRLCLGKDYFLKHPYPRVQAALMEWFILKNYHKKNFMLIHLS